MGVGTLAYLVAWFIYFLINGIYVSIIFIVPLKLFGFFDNVQS
jgi:hypothetical protein